MKGFRVLRLREETSTSFFATRLIISFGKTTIQFAAVKNTNHFHSGHERKGHLPIKQ